MSFLRRGGVCLMGIGMMGLASIWGQTATNWLQPLLLAFAGLICIWAAATNRVS